MDFSGLSLADLRVIAKEKGLKGISALKKSELIATLEAVEKEKNLEEKRYWIIFHLRQIKECAWEFWEKMDVESLRCFPYLPEFRKQMEEVFAGRGKKC